MQGKTVVITGATSGIGEVAAVKLAQMGARIVLVVRDRSRGERTLVRLRTRAPNLLAHSVHYADLTRISEMKRVAAEIAKAEPRIGVLINNAGAMFSTRKLTEDGLEYTFALNHMAYFVVTQGLRERLVTSAPARVGGRAHLSSKLTRVLLHETCDLSSTSCATRGRRAMRTDQEVDGRASCKKVSCPVLRQSK